MKVSCGIFSLLLDASLAFIVIPSQSNYQSNTKVTTSLEEKKAEAWGVEDDWSKFSVDSAENAIDGSAIFNINPALQAAQRMEDGHFSTFESSEEDDFISDAVDTIYSPVIDADSPVLYDTKPEFDQYTKSVSFLDEMGKEISLLVRCNESPDELLVSVGRKLPKLTDEEKYNSEQLVMEVTTLTDKKSTHYEPTDFFTDAVRVMFYLHSSNCVSSSSSSMDVDEDVLDTAGIASWMSKSLNEKIGRFDKRIALVIAKYSSYGSGALTLSQFMQLYMDAASLSIKTKHNVQVRGGGFYAKKKKAQLPTIQSVWRDLENHGFRPPVLEERDIEQERLDEEYGKVDTSPSKPRTGTDSFMDECEILEWDEKHYGEHSRVRDSSTSQMEGADINTKKSSHEFVQMTSDDTTPARLRDGDFVFIDEESCIGCRQCVDVAPSTFVMTESGRARTFSQSNSEESAIAVSICPVGCMHNIAFHELKEMETARDVGIPVGEGASKIFRNYQRHIPLHVARTDSDVNRRSSLYHSLKHKCSTSSTCPQRGCYDCPAYNAAGDNPFFKERHEKAEHVRAQGFIESGEANEYRKFSDL